MEEKSNKSLPVRIALAMALWAFVLWLLTLGHPALVPIARAIFVVLVIPYGVVEFLKYKGVVGEQKAGIVRLAAIIGAAVVWYLVREFY